MCGLAGFYQPGGFAKDSAGQVVRKMAGGLLHRGPDDAGSWVDGDAGIAIGHQRLAVLELSAAGHQPMSSASGRFVLAFNGEIYNHLLLREELQKSGYSPDWRGHSDTETLLAAFECWDVKTALQKSVGMFAIALWDRKERVLTLARDRIGEKPLYYGWQDGKVFFGSELRALRAHPGCRLKIDRNVLAMYFNRGYIEAPHSIYENIYKLVPGTFLRIDALNDGVPERVQNYWSLSEVVDRAASQPFAGDDQAAISELRSILQEAVALQAVADVPVGAFLSGGIDSTTVVALMQAQSSRRVRSFTIGFEEEEYNEAPHARAVAQHLGTDHTDLQVTAREAMDIIPTLPQIYDEPFGDSSAIPTILVSRLAKRHVTVSLSGDSGDELFGGYRRYQRVAEIWRTVNRVPKLARRPLSLTLSALSRLRRHSDPGRKAQQFSVFLSAQSREVCYHRYLQQRQNIRELVYGTTRQVSHPNAELPSSFNGGFFESMMFADTLSYLPDDLLTKVDRAAMSVSLETRIPMLDHRVVEFAWQLPMHFKIRQGEGKWLLKQVLRKYVPDEMIDRPKMGFGVPVGRWLRGPLRDWAESLLSADKLRAQGYLNPAIVHKEWQHHLKGDGLAADRIWQILMFQAWLAEFGDTA